MSSIQNTNDSITDVKNASESIADCELSPEPRESFVFRVVLLVCIMVMSVVGNGLVCCGALKRRQRPFSYYLVTNLAVAELLFTAVQPFHFFYDTKPYSWVFGTFMCHVVDPMTTCANLVITFTLAAIAVYRCVMMLQPHRYRGSSTNVAYMVICGSWIWGIALSLPDSITRERYLLKDCNIFLCRNSEDLPDYRMAIFILKFVIPFIVMVSSYCDVIFKVKKHLVKTRQQPIELFSNESPGNETRSIILTTDVPKQQSQTRDREPNEPNRNISPVPILESSANPRHKTLSNKMMRLEADVLNMIYLIIVLFFLCYLPSNLIFILVEGLGVMSIQLWPHFWLMMKYLTLLHMIPSAFHPICYGASSRVLGLFCRCPSRRRRFKK